MFLLKNVVHSPRPQLLRLPDQLLLPERRDLPLLRVYRRTRLQVSGPGGGGGNHMSICQTNLKLPAFLDKILQW